VNEQDPLRVEGDEFIQMTAPAVDGLLQNIVLAATSFGLPVGICLQVKGLVVYGRLIGIGRFFEVHRSLMDDGICPSCRLTSKRPPRTCNPIIGGHPCQPQPE
jgi:hypothetical protein